jgi:hypothetical protein
MAKSTPAQTFKRIFDLWMHPGTEPEVRANAERQMDAWLKRHSKTRADIASILAQAANDNAAAAPPSPPPDPRATQFNPFDDPKFTPVGLVHGITERYLFMADHVAVIYALWIVFTHVYTRFEVAPRLRMWSEEPDSGKSIARKVARHLVFRPNEEALGSAASLRDYIAEGPGTLLLDELDYVEPDALRNILKIWNLGHERGAKISLKVEGRRKLFDTHAPILGAGLGEFLEHTQQSRTFRLDMEQYTAETMPERRYDSHDVGDLDNVYAYLRHWVPNAKLNPDPDTSGLIRRFADNARGLLAVADACSPEWGLRAREALAAFAEREKAAQMHYLIIKHGLAIFDAAGLTKSSDVISTLVFNRELLRLDLPDAGWSQYREPGGRNYPHAITIGEQAALLRRKPNTVQSRSHWPAGAREPGVSSVKVYRRGDFETALAKHEKHGRPLLRLVE